MQELVIVCFSSCVCVPASVYLLELVCWACYCVFAYLCGCACLHLCAEFVCGHIGMWQSRQRSSRLQSSRTLHWQFCHFDAGKSVLSGVFTNLNGKGMKQCPCLIITLSLTLSRCPCASAWLCPSLWLDSPQSPTQVGLDYVRCWCLAFIEIHWISLNFMKPAQTRPPFSLKRSNKIACAKNSACAFFGFTSIDCLIVAQSTQALILTLGGQGWRWRETDSSGWHVIESN